MRTITKSISVKATPDKVWEVITAPAYVSEWAEIFTPGAKAQSDYKTGSDVVWSGDDGKSMRGTVAESVPGRSLKIAFPAGQAPGMDNEQIETFTLVPEGDGVTKLTATHGPFKDEHFDDMAKPWDQALQVIKSLAEEDQSPRTEGQSTGANPRA